MPHLKFSRDKKGYEHTSLVRPARKGGRGEGRILYWFRTPPHVKVGRSALDEEAIRLIEEHHPEITFDWPRILKAQPVVEEEPSRPRSSGTSVRQGEPRKRKRQSRGARRDAQPSQPPQPHLDAEPVSSVEPEPLEPVEPEPLEPVEPEPLEPVEPVPPVLTMIEAAAQAGGPSEWEAPVEAEPPDRTSEGGERAEGKFLSPRPVEALVGAEGLERLRARHAALLAAISERIQDAAKREFLRGEAEGLDPDNWVTIDAARAALETYEADYEAIRRQLPARRRKRRRGRRSKNRPGNAAAPAPQAADTEAAAPAGPEPQNGSGTELPEPDEPEP